MTSRRTFLTGSMALAATGSTAAAFAGSHQQKAAKAPVAGIVYTKQQPGMWAKKVGGHLPEMEISGETVKIVTNHGMSSRHFIVRHTLVLEDGTVSGSKTFSPEDEAESVHTLPKGYKGKVYATSFCNKHDLWMSEAMV